MVLGQLKIINGKLYVEESNGEYKIILTVDSKKLCMVIPSFYVVFEFRIFLNFSTNKSKALTF